MENSLLSFSNQLFSIAEQSGPAIAGVHSDPRTAASGVHWRPVTAAHALRRDDDVRITGASGAELKAEVAGRDPGSDLAVLKVSGFDAPVAKQAAAADTKVGQLVLALGRIANELGVPLRTHTGVRKSLPRIRPPSEVKTKRVRAPTYFMTSP